MTLPVGSLDCMADIEVVPQEIFLAARKVEEAGNAFGLAAQTLSDTTADASIYGNDELGAALVTMDFTASPAAIQYYIATSNAVREVSVGMTRIGEAYMAVEEDNSAEIVAIFIEMGIM